MKKRHQKTPEKRLKNAFGLPQRQARGSFSASFKRSRLDLRIGLALSTAL
jgi:hypothetical protein